MKKFLIIAHRGAPNYARENTMESFKKAIDLGADMIELDVRRTKDHQLIIYHDEFLKGRPIKDLIYGDLSKLTEDQGFTIPTLEEVLTYALGKIKLGVELKEEGYETEVVGWLSRYFHKDHFVVTSFYDSCIRRIKDDDPDIKTGLILGIAKPRNFILTRFSEFFPLKRCREAKADFLVPHWRLLRFGFLDRARREHKPVFVWTVNDRKMILKFLHDGRIDGIITDQPDVAVSLRQQFESRAQAPSNFYP